MKFLPAVLWCFTAMTSFTTAAGKSPWGIALGAEWSGEYAKVNPLLREAGVKWMRYFPEWRDMQPEKGKWDFKLADDFLASAKANDIQLAGGFWYAAPWATSDGSTRTVPLKNLQDWRDYVTGMVSRYGNDVRWWEVWNEFNGSFSKGGNPQLYAELVREASIAAKAVDPQIKIGLSVANFDVGYLDATIKAGAAGHFDYVCVHPYENLGSLADGGERGYLSLAASLRQMLAANGQSKDLPLWITEMGFQSSVEPDAEADRKQAEIFTKGYVLSPAQGFDKVFWFEARGPAYGKGTDHGIIRKNWSKRPVYDAYQMLTKELGAEPDYLGWLDLDGAFGFVFRNGDDARLVAWADSEKTVKFGDRELSLTRQPAFFGKLSAADLARAKSNADKPFPWGIDFAKANQVTCKLGATNRDEGISQIKIEGTTTVFHGLDFSAVRSSVKDGGEKFYAYFRVDPTFVPFGTTDLEITVVAKRLEPKKSAMMKLTYESTTGYKTEKESWAISETNEWSEFAWQVTDANFAGGWGWNFRTDAGGSPGDFLIKEVRVRKK